jgi:TolB-like protein
MKLKKYIAELKRRNVFKSAITYLIAAWLILQVVSTVIPLFDASERNVLKILLIILSVGFPFWIAFSWVYDITSEGILKTEVEDIDQKSQRSVFDNKRFYIVIIASLTITVVLLLFNQFWSKTKVDPNSSQIETSVEKERKSIAVLPFVNRSNLKEDEHFTDGVHDDLLTQISKIKEIKTISRTSVMEYRNTTKNMRVIGEELGVATILEGGVQRAGNQIRINVKLIDVITDANLWAETYTKELTAENIFAIQSEISLAIATALKTILSPQEQEKIDNLPTKNLAALEAWYQAKESMTKQTNIDRQEAIDYLNLAIKLDSTFAIAYAVLGQETLDKFWWANLPIKEQINKAKPLIEKAMRLDSTISDVAQ